jgi:UDP-N-acetyl-D-glucosamine dehydrogenase
VSAARLDLAVVGLGYVGLPVAVGAVRGGLRVAGLDISEEVVAAVNDGRSRIDDIADAEIAEMVEEGFHATTDPAILGRADAVVICVPTPLSFDDQPDLDMVLEAGRTVADHVHAGQLVVLESTTYPGTTDEMLRPILEESGLVAGEDFNLAYSPERIDPGNPTWGLRNTPKVVGGLTPACRDRAVALYGAFVDEVVAAHGTREAEMAKLLENTYRHVNIALVNEMAVFCNELGVDLWEAIRLASSKPFGFSAFYPGPGVGGHCIPVDPSYLSYKVRTLGYPFRFVELAKEINGRMPTYVATRAMWALNDAGKPVRGSRVLLLGVTYKSDIADERESPAVPLGVRLLELGADLAYHDPYVARWHINGLDLERVDDLEAAVAAADLVIVVQAHRAYDLEAVAAKAQLVLDTRGELDGEHVERL